jgi:hypothetical protein
LPPRRSLSEKPKPSQVAETKPTPKPKLTPQKTKQADSQVFQQTANALKAGIYASARLLPGEDASIVPYSRDYQGLVSLAAVAVGKKNRKHAVKTAAALFYRLDRGRRFSGGPFVGDDLLKAFDTVLGEGGHAILTDAIDAQAAIFGEHVDREFVQPVLVLAKYLGDIGDGEDGGDGSQGQAA